MGAREFIKSKEELEGIADMLAEEITPSEENIISRYTRIISSVASFFNGKRLDGESTNSNLNKEMMERRIYTQTDLDEIMPHNFPELVVSRDLQQNRFDFHHKGFPLPTTEESFVESIPTNIQLYDDEFIEFTKEHRNTRITRGFNVEQKIIVNSKGGKVVQSIPFFDISYSHGYTPITSSRNICVVCSSDEEMRRLPELVQFIADPTPDKRIKNAGSFTGAFHELHKISGLKFGSLEEAGIPLAGLYDVVVLTGVPAHEVFGHHFEEPIRYLNFGETGTFRYGQDIKNHDIILQDNPQQEVAGFKVQGFSNVDAYGRRKSLRTHIKDSRCVEYLGSEYADLENFRKYLNMDKSDFVGSAAQHTDGAFPQPRMSCTVLDGKTENVDLEGKILMVSHTGETNIQHKTYVVSANECYVVRDGEPRRVIPLIVTGAINHSLATMTLLDDWCYNTGFCGKPDPLARGRAQVPVSQFTRSQMWNDQQVYPLPISDVHLKVLMT